MLLDKPTFLQATMQSDVAVIDVRSLNGAYLLVQAKRWFNAGTRDKATLYFKESGRGFLTFVQHNAQQIDWAINPELVSDGDYETFYIAENLAENQTPSAVQKVRVVNSPSIDFPAPRFPHAVYDSTIKHNTLYFKTLRQDHGTPIEAVYATMKAGDVVTFKLRATTNSDNEVPAASHPLDPVVVSDDDIKNGHVLVRAPLAPFLAAGNRGTVYARYRVDGMSADSPESQVSLSWSDIDTLALNITQRAPEWTAPLQARNVVTIFGRPGLQFTLAVDGSAKIVTNRQPPAGESAVDGTLDDQGLASYRIIQPAVGAGGLATLVAVVASDNPEVEPASDTALFDEWLPGSSDLEAYGFSTGAPADGHTPCMVYLRYAPDTAATSVGVRVSGSATIVGHRPDQNGVVELPLDPVTRTCAVQFVDTVAETVTAQVVAGDAAPLPLPLMFVNFPFDDS